MNWTTEYPTRPGLYWISNYRYEHYTGSVFAPGATIVELDADLDISFVGGEESHEPGYILSAEWFGPIQPPTERRPGAVPCVRCAWCEKVTDQLIAWTAQGAGGFYHGAIVCRECYDRKFTQPPQENDK